MSVTAMKAVHARCGPSPRLAEMLESHPHVDSVVRADVDGLEFSMDGWRRRVLVGDRKAAFRGLVELMDNNPLVCADEISVPSPASTLALIAVGPLARAGILAGNPDLRFDFDADPADVIDYLTTEGWSSGASVNRGHRGRGLLADVQGALTCVASCPISAPNEPGEVEALYDESYGRAFYVQQSETSSGAPELVIGRPFAFYWLNFEPKDEASLLRIQVVADRDGKCGAAQIVHAMNVMAGFEESLGIGEWTAQA